jgi:phage gp29-like protein
VGSAYREREIARLEAEIRELKAKLRRMQRETDEREVSLREELEPQMREVVAFARQRGHTWLDRSLIVGPPAEDDDELAERLAQAFFASEVPRLQVDVESLVREVRAKGKELKKEKESLASLREMFGHPTD